MIPDSLHRLADDGGGKRDRTDDPLLAKQVLYQLSYAPIRVKVMVGLGGLEPPTPRLSSVCSNQLSYKPRSLRLGVATKFFASLIYSLPISVNALSLFYL